MFSFIGDKSKKTDYKKLLDQANTAYGSLTEIKIPTFNKNVDYVDIDKLNSELHELFVIAYNQDNGFEDLTDRFDDANIALNKHVKILNSLEQQWEQAFRDVEDFVELLETNLIYFSTQYQLFEKALTKWFDSEQMPEHPQLIEKIKKINKKASLNAHGTRTYNKEMTAIFTKEFESENSRLLYLCRMFERLSYRSDLCIDALQILTIMPKKSKKLIKYSPNAETLVKYYRKSVMGCSKKILLLAHSTVKANGHEVYEQVFD